MTVHRYVSVMRPLSDLVTSRGYVGVLASVFIWTLGFLAALPALLFTSVNENMCDGAVVARPMDKPPMSTEGVHRYGEDGCGETCREICLLGGRMSKGHAVACIPLPESMPNPTELGRYG
ncbi:unnamed protein product [Gadus morhua 'NCC']